MYADELRRCKKRHCVPEDFTWVFFIKEAENLEVMPENLNDEGLRAAYQDANRHSWTKAEVEAYDYAAMREQDERGKIVAAEKRAKRETAKELIKLGISPDVIRQATGLSDEEIGKLM